MKHTFNFISSSTKGIVTNHEPKGGAREVEEEKKRLVEINKGNGEKKWGESSLSEVIMRMENMRWG